MTRIIKGPFTRETLARIHAENPFHKDDIVISKTGSKFLVFKIYPDTPGPFKNAFVLVGAKKGKMFTVYGLRPKAYAK